MSVNHEDALQERRMGQVQIHMPKECKVIHVSSLSKPSDCLMRPLCYIKAYVKLCSVAFVFSTCCVVIVALCSYMWQMFLWKDE